jgi:hypothetical protein
MRKKNSPALLDVVYDWGNWGEEGGWCAVVRDPHGGEFCRCRYATQTGAEDGLAELRKLLSESGGDVVTALERWSGHPVQLPFWAAEALERLGRDT